MLEKYEILIVIITLLIIFYLVISFGSGYKRKAFQSLKIKSYIYSVRILITIIGIVALILWFFL